MAPVEPVSQRRLCDDTTIEALAAVLNENPRGVLVACDELASWLCGFDRYRATRGAEVAKWLEIYGGRPLIVDRRTATPPQLLVPYAAASVTGGIQPAVLARALRQGLRENGLLARLLVACPPWAPAEWTEADIEPPVAAARLALVVHLTRWAQGEAMNPDKAMRRAG